MLNELFTNQKIPDRYIQRPLGAVSSYVVEELPKDLEDHRRGKLSEDQLLELVKEVVESVDREKVDELSSQPISIRENGYVLHAADLVSLDLKILRAGLLFSGATVPENLTCYITRLSAATLQRRSLGYEEIVYVNPRRDMRTFTRGKVGRSEADFYSGHVLIDGRYYKVKSRIDDARKILVAEDDPEIAARYIMEGVDSAVEANIVMGEYKRSFDRDHFNEFRKYLGTDPETGDLGPSGNFSGIFPTIDVLLNGHQLPEEHRPYMMERMGYLPRRDRMELSEAFRVVESENTLVQLWKQRGESSVLKSAILELDQQIANFRAYHYGAVADKVPDAIKGAIQGTGGENHPGMFLKMRMKEHRVKFN